MSERPSIHPDDEARVADEMSRELELVAGQSHIPTPPGFADRVMASIAGEPVPQPARAFGAALGARRLGAALAAIGDAWRVAVGGRAPLAVRAQALALVLVVAVASVALAGGATVGAIDLLNANQPPHPSPTVPLPSEPESSVSPSPSPNQDVTIPESTAEPTTSQDAGETPEATDNGGGSDGTTATPRPTRTEDHGGEATASPTGSDDGGDGGGSGGDGETPRPTGSDDHSGGGDG